MDIPERTNFFLKFNDKYQDISSYGIWAHVQYDKLTKEEIEEFGIKLSEFPPMTLNHLKERIKYIDDKIPLEYASKYSISHAFGVLSIRTDNCWILSP